MRIARLEHLKQEPERRDQDGSTDDDDDEHRRQRGIGRSGRFTITGAYSCNPGSQVYLYALGGDPGAGVNSAAGLLAVLGNCPAPGNFLAATPFVSVNEVSTIAAAYAMP